MRRRPVKPTGPPRPRIAVPVWLRPSLVFLSCLVLAGLFSKEISNSDFWWQLRTGQYVWQTRSLPDPDPFAYTTATAGYAYPGEEITRRFNLTHEWLAQTLLYLVYQTTGFGGVVLSRALLLIAFCAFAGLITYRRCGGFYRSIAAAFAAAAVAAPFAVDRPFLVTFLLLSITLAIMESQKPPRLWLMPAVMLIWANCHGGFVLGWLVMAAYSAEAIFLRLRGRPRKDDTRLWAVCAASVLISGLNPNGFHIVAVLLNYRKSWMTSTLLEWEPPHLWPPEAFSVLLLLAALALLWARRRVRLVDWLLFVGFGAAALVSARNTILIGVLAPVLIATYVPWKRPVHAYAQFGAAALLLAGFGAVLAGGQAFQLHAAEWAYPAGAADFVLSHQITGRMYNTYEYGGYLMWKLWPRQRVFIDGRGLSESVFADYRCILYNANADGGKSATQLLDRYGIQVVVMNTFEYTSGTAYVLAPALSDPDNPDWKLVYADAQAVVFLRHPPEGVPVLDSSQVLSAMQSECALHIEHEPQFPGCARNLGQMFSHNGDFANARRWLGVYLEHAPAKDPEAESALRQMVQAQ